MEKQRSTALGVYIFAGGWTAGVADHFNVIGDWEDIPYYSGTFRRNFPGVPYYQDLNWPVAEYRGRVDYMYANPPCAAWSAAGASMIKGGSNWLTDPRVNCFRNAFRAIELVQPVVATIESVTRAFTLGRPLIDELTRKALDLGYSVTYFFTDAVLHGVPQRRRRFMLVLHKVKLRWPVPTYPLITPREALRGLPDDLVNLYPFSESWVRAAEGLPEGGSFREAWLAQNPDEVRGKPPFLVHRSFWDKPVGTLLSMATHIHPSEPRYFHPEEVARLCGYPDSFVWEGRRTQWQAQMTQAVLPNVGRYVAGVASRGIDAGVPAGGQVSAVDFRKEVQKWGLR